MVFWILVGVSISCSSGDDFVGVVVVLETVVCVMSMAQTSRVVTTKMTNEKGKL